MDNENSTIQYRNLLLGKWLEILDLGEEWRTNYLIDKPDLEKQSKYLGKLTTLWTELNPKVQGRSDLKNELPRRFADLQIYVDDPRLLTTKDGGDPTKILVLHNTISEGLYQLGITKYEGG